MTLVARLGGDEFAVILTSIANQELAKSAMNRIEQACGLPFIFENFQLSMGASIGLAVYPEDAQGLEQLLECADLKMYENKREKKQIHLNG
ncbi:diguanylate cyclase domain-containing protein [Acinetobacter sp. BSP-28]|uniref:diguanylate cyclase domain-containing protein n=1 Tax=Acinetobacter sp. BSP-28 TaxID=3344661 RepID=UPI00377019F9